MKKTVILLLAALMLPLCQFIHAQRRGDYRTFGTIPNTFRLTVSHVRWTADDSEAAALNFSCHYDYLLDCNYPVSLDIYPANFGDYHGDPGGTLAFYNQSTLDARTLTRCIIFLGRSRSQQVKDFGERITTSCASGGGFYLKVSDFNMLDEHLFFDTPALEQAEIGSGVRHLLKGTFRDCKNLKYVKFGPNVIKIDQDCFLGCSGLEVVEFENGDVNSIPLLKFDIRYMFHTDFNRSDMYCTNMKAFVVPDHLVSEYK
ncbi:MAG: leucine-rich repeat domain-containing protein, partial [Dysgonamonadaceae bacterium]|nr:leucine-rich repeat domain-containing protein [Dysgonamonadaceae bacterium]